ncbi:MAG: high-affinity nickel-transporter [Chloroflexota bacterium]|nr:high-affinity nickel-transporter [Chloroflexota bacterium]
MIRPRRSLMALALLAPLVLAGVAPLPAAAHPLGNFTVNQYSRIEVTEEDLRLVYVLDMAEIPALQELQERVDADGDGAVSDAERDTYLGSKLGEITSALGFSLGEMSLALRPVERELTFPDGQAGLKLLRLRAVFVAPLAGLRQDGTGRLSYRNDFASNRLGWREVVVTHGPGVRLDASDVPETDVSDELRTYPQHLLSSPLNRTAATFSVTLVPGAAAATGFEAAPADGQVATSARATRPDGGSTGGRFAALVTGQELTAVGIAVSLLAALVWGAAHALSPGHGKTVVGAYLVGSRGTTKHALFLGLTVTLTHTAGVLGLGVATLVASRYVVPEQLYPWMSLVSGLLVVAMGLVIFRQRLRGLPAFGHHHHHHHHHHGPADHTHDHHHDHHHGHGHSHGSQAHSHLPPGADGSRVTWRGLLALGISGGLLPCPSALVVLLGSIALGRAGFGLLLVLAFSLGLATALTGVGLLFLFAGRLLERQAPTVGWPAALLRYAPVAGAGVVTLVGLGIVVRALGETQLL